MPSGIMQRKRVWAKQTLQTLPEKSPIHAIQSGYKYVTIQGPPDLGRFKRLLVKKTRSCLPCKNGVWKRQGNIWGFGLSVAMRRRCGNHSLHTTPVEGSSVGVRTV